MGNGNSAPVEGIEAGDSTARSPMNQKNESAITPSAVEATNDERPPLSTLTKPSSLSRQITMDPENDTAIILDPRCLFHATEVDKICALGPGHEPERPLRIVKIYERLQKLGLLSQVSLDVAELPPREALLSVHSADYLQRLRSLASAASADPGIPSGLGLRMPDLVEARSLLENPQALAAFLEKQVPAVSWSRKKAANGIVDDNAGDNPHTEWTPVAAALSAGAVTRLVDTVAGGHAVNGMSIMRPPGHHCSPNKASGFCYLANVAIGVKWAREAHGVRKVAVVDWDIHAGDGTEAALADDPDVLVISLHRNDKEFFPEDQPCGPSNIGCNPSGKFVNIGWEGANAPHGMGDNEYAAAFATTVLPLLAAFQPEMIFVSCGYDAADGDPLGGQAVSPPMYGTLTRMLGALDPPRGLLLVLEGGYNVDSIAASAAETVKALVDLSRTSRRRWKPALEADAPDPDASFLRRRPVGDAASILTVPASTRPMHFEARPVGLAVHGEAIAALRRTLESHAPHSDVAGQALKPLALARTLPQLDVELSTYADAAQLEPGTCVMLWREGKGTGADRYEGLFVRLPVGVFSRGESETITGNVREEKEPEKLVTRLAHKLATSSGASKAAGSAVPAWKACSRSYVMSVELQAVTGGGAHAFFRIRDELLRVMLDVQLRPNTLDSLARPAALDKIPADVLAAGLPKEFYKAKFAIPVLLRGREGASHPEQQPAYLVLYSLSSFTLPCDKAGHCCALAVVIPGPSNGTVSLGVDMPCGFSLGETGRVSGSHAAEWGAAWEAWIHASGHDEIQACPDMLSDTAVQVAALAVVSHDKNLLKKLAEAAGKASAIAAGVKKESPPLVHDMSRWPVPAPGPPTATDATDDLAVILAGIGLGTGSDLQQAEEFPGFAGSSPTTHAQTCGQGVEVSTPTQLEVPALGDWAAMCTPESGNGNAAPLCTMDSLHVSRRFDGAPGDDARQRLFGSGEDKVWRAVLADAQGALDARVRSEFQAVSRQIAPLPPAGGRTQQKPPKAAAVDPASSLPAGTPAQAVKNRRRSGAGSKM